MSHRRALLVLFVAVACLTSPWLARPWSAAPATVAADRLVASAGVNVHLHYDNTLYRSQFSLVQQRLIELGVRHVRDGLEDTTWMPYYERHNSLGEAGIKATFITSPEQGAELWASYPARMKSTFEAYEAPNEYDQSRRDDWAPVLTDALRRLHGLKSNPSVAHFPIYGPSLTSPTAYATLGDVSRYYDFANLHNYFAGRHPGTPGWGDGGYGSIAWNLALAAKYAPGKPVVTTETGYQDDLSLANSVPPDVAGRYLPIGLLEQFRAGIVRTYLYELADFPKSGGYGLLREDGSRKPAFTAVKSLLNLLADPGPSFTPTNLEYSVTEGTGDTRHMAFRKRSGTYFVALWQVRPCYDPVTRTPIHVEPEQVKLTVPTTQRYGRTHHWQLDGSLSTTPWTTIASAISVTIADRLVMVEVSAAPPAPTNLRRVSDDDANGSR